MLPDIKSASAQAGDLVELISPSRKMFVFRLAPGGKLHTHRGVILHDDLIGKPWGSEVHSHQGSVFFFLQPTLADILAEIPRSTQIMYPKDIGFVLVIPSENQSDAPQDAGNTEGTSSGGEESQ